MYIISLITLVSLSLDNEQYKKSIYWNEEEGTVHGFKDNPHSVDLKFLIITNILLTTIQTIINVAIMRGMGWNYFKRFNSWVDIFLVLINFTTFLYMTKSDSSVIFIKLH